MKRSATGPGTFGCALLAFTLSFSMAVQTEAGETPAPSTQSDQEVQDRGVPRRPIPKGRFKQVQPPRTTPQGYVQQGDKIVAQPGFVLEPGQNNQVTPRIAGGGIAGRAGATSLQCACVSSEGTFAEGTCTMSIIGSEASCQKGAGATCTAKCSWATVITGLRHSGQALQPQ